MPQGNYNSKETLQTVEMRITEDAYNALVLEGVITDNMTLAEINQELRDLNNLINQITKKIIFWLIKELIP